MKAILAVIGFLGGMSVAQAQGTLYLSVDLDGANEVPPNASRFLGFGDLELVGNVLNYSVGMGTYTNTFFIPTSAGIYGPAGPGQTGPLILDLGSYLLSANPPWLGYGGGFFLTASQIADLEAGLWYVNFASSAYPNGEIRGQILPVPEPSPFALIVAGCLLARCAKLGRPRFVQAKRFHVQL